MKTTQRWVFHGVLAALVWMAVEIAALGIIEGTVHDGLRGLRDIQTAYKFMGARQSTHSETFHPYLGWVHNPDLVPNVDCCGLELKTNRYGLFDSSDGVHHKRPDRLIVAIAGGSVAWQMSCAGADVLRHKLQEIPAYREREIIFVRLAQSGYKQPQALFALNYYLLLGGEFDIVMNLDGYNETALPTCENLIANVALDYPQGWHARTLDIVDPRDADASFRVFEIRGLRQRLALASLESPFRVFPSYQLIWYFRENRLRSQLIEIEEDLMARGRERKRGFLHAGPHPLAKNQEEAIVESVRIWKQASLQMHRICEAHQILYVHAIQPNQYDPGSKPLSEYEKEKCYSDSVEYGKIVKRAYPLLRAEGLALQTLGVRHVDLTQLFAQVTETLYVDPYCHVNQRGSELLAEALGNQVILTNSDRVKK